MSATPKITAYYDGGVTEDGQRIMRYVIDKDYEIDTTDLTALS